jgi:hypothetical protein
VASGLMIGSSFLFFYHLADINAHSKSIASIDTLVYVGWISDTLARIIGGMICYFKFENFDEYILAIIACSLSLLGFALLFFTSQIYYTVVLVSIAYGLWWTIPALIIGSRVDMASFAQNWSIILASNYIGIVLFYFLYEAISNYTKSSFDISLLTFACTSLFAGLLT